MSFQPFFDAIRLLTIFPAPASDRPPQTSMAFWFAPVGAMIAGTLASVHLAMTHAGWGGPGGAAVRAIVLTCAWLLITRGLHIDGVGDTFDALGVVGDRARKLAILRDPHIGSMGAAAIAVVVAAKILLIETIPSDRVGAALFCSIVTARAATVLSCAVFPYARTEGLGTAIIGRGNLFHVGVAVVSAGAIATVAGRTGWTAAAAGGAGGILVAWSAHLSLGGITGDVLGAGIEISECAALFAFVLAT